MPSEVGSQHALTDEDHDVDVVQTLDAIDIGWPEHLALERPA